MDLMNLLEMFIGVLFSDLCEETNDVSHRVARENQSVRFYLKLADKISGIL